VLTVKWAVFPQVERGEKARERKHHWPKTVIGNENSTKSCRQFCGRCKLNRAAERTGRKTEEGLSGS
jgi:hypothetical protein